MSACPRREELLILQRTTDLFPFPFRVFQVVPLEFCIFLSEAYYGEEQLESHSFKDMGSICFFRIIFISKSLLVCYWREKRQEGPSIEIWQEKSMLLCNPRFPYLHLSWINFYIDLDAFSNFSHWSLMSEVSIKRMKINYC